jgi:hypothetical protein
MVLQTRKTNLAVFSCICSSGRSPNPQQTGSYRSQGIKSHRDQIGYRIEDVCALNLGFFLGWLNNCLLTLKGSRGFGRAHAVCGFLPAVRELMREHKTELSGRIAGARISPRAAASGPEVAQAFLHARSGMWLESQQPDRHLTDRG